MLRLLYLLLLLSASAAGFAEQNPWTFNLYFENDLFAESDQNYTNGLRMSWVSPDISAYETDPVIPQWLRGVNDKLHFLHQLKDRKKLSRNLVVSLGQLIYTPQTIDAVELLPDQRPYAGFLYADIAYHTRSRDQLDTVGLVLGIVGPDAYAKEAQDFIHDLRGFDKFQGWDNQLGNELGVQLLYEHKHHVFRHRSALEHDLIGHTGLSLGNVASYLNLGFEYRLGWNLPEDFGTSAVRPGGDNSAPGSGDPRLKRSGFSGIHAFVSTDARLVARDIFLDGNTFANSHSVDKEKLVGDISAGLSVTVSRWKISFAKVFRSREFKKQPHSHSYGSLSISYSH